jgi:hypothetical protein
MLSSDANRIHAGGDVLEDARMPHALLAFTVRSVVIQVGQLADERAFPTPGPPTMATRTCRYWS